MATKCTGIMGRIFGHKFVPVVTKSAVKRPVQIEGSAQFMRKLLDAYREETFNGSVCQRCGAVTGGKNDS